ncbi:uncharacterized protein LOC120477307 [Pimephales promelas]|uniref:uncharacterized protein LOC120477307 n=1 Tax=Pimephales promelas TaxID=90988 RepID=UPI0019559CCD|nr:uncharacterized protein LOC120477307 [Pimephales promelas]KAG1928138.1 hypothetical protein F2P79_023768 [Pimephales promelas]
MGPQLHFCSTYSEEFSYPARVKPTRPRPSSACRRNNPHPRPDFLMPRTLQTGYGSRKHFQLAAPSTSFLPPVRHISIQYPDEQTGHQQTMQSSSQGDSKPPEVSSAVCTLPPAAWLLKPQQTNFAHATITNTQGKYSDTDRIRSAWNQQMDIMPSLKPFKHQVTHHYRRSRSKSTADCSEGHSCFHVVKPYKVGHYIIHPEFVSEAKHY